MVSVGYVRLYSGFLRSAWPEQDEEVMPEWLQYWLVAMVTLNTTVNLIVFFRGRKFKQ